MTTTSMQSPTKSTQVYGELRREITSGLIPLGQPLVRRQLAERYGVSLSIVNEALARLVHDGLVESPEKESTRVVKLDEEQLANDFALREAVERHVARLLAQNASDETLGVLRQDACSLDTWIATEGPNSALHLEFHLKMARATGFQSLEQTLRRGGIRHLLTLRWLQRQDIPHPANFHERLIAEFMRRDPALADQMMGEHLHFGDSAFRA